MTSASNSNTVSAHSSIEIIVNGKASSVPSDATVHDFLVSKRMTDAMAIVERNGEIVPRSSYGDTPLQAGDRLEVVHAVGGG
jgi:sulfur carrier protein